MSSDDSFLQYKMNLENHILKMPNIPVFKRAAIKRPLFPKKSPVVLRIRESPSFGAQLGKRALICSTPMDIYRPKLFVNEFSDNSLIFSPVQSNSAHAKKISKKYDSGDLRGEKKRKKHTNSTLKSVMQQLMAAKNARKSANGTSLDQIQVNKSAFKERPDSGAEKAKSDKTGEQLIGSKGSSSDSVVSVKTPINSEAQLHKAKEVDNKIEENGCSAAENVLNFITEDDNAANKSKPLLTVQNRRVTALVERQTQTTNSLEKLPTRSFCNLNNKPNTTTKRKLINSDEHNQLEVTLSEEVNKECPVPVLNGKEEFVANQETKDRQNEGLQKATVEAKEKEITENEVMLELDNVEINKSTQHLLNALDSKIYMGSVITISSESELTAGEEAFLNKIPESNSPVCIEEAGCATPSVGNGKENHKLNSSRKVNERSNESHNAKTVSTLVQSTSTNKNSSDERNERNNVKELDLSKEVRKTVNKIKDLKKDTFAKPQPRERKRKSTDDSVIKRETKAKNKAKPSVSRVSKAPATKTSVQERASTFRMSGFLPFQIDEENSEEQAIVGVRKSTRGRRAPAAFIQSVFVGPTARGIIFSALPSSASGTFGKSRATRSKSVKSRQSKMSCYKTKDNELEQNEQPENKQADPVKSNSVAKPTTKKSELPGDEKTNKPTKANKTKSKSKKSTKTSETTSKVENHLVNSNKNESTIETDSMTLRSGKVKNIVEANASALQSNELEISRVNTVEIVNTTETNAIKGKSAKEATTNNYLGANNSETISINSSGMQLRSKRNLTNTSATALKTKTNVKCNKNNSDNLEVSSTCEGYSMTLRSRTNRQSADITTSKLGSSKLNTTKNNSKNSSKLIRARQSTSNQNLSPVRESDVAKDNTAALQLGKNVSLGSLKDKSYSRKTSVIEVNSDVNRSNGYIEESLETFNIEQNVPKFLNGTEIETQESFVVPTITVQATETLHHKKKTLSPNPAILSNKRVQTNNECTTEGNRISFTLDSGVSVDSVACNQKTAIQKNLHVLPTSNNNNNNSNSKLSRNSCKRSVTCNELPKINDKVPDSPLNIIDEVKRDVNENDFSKFHEEDDGGMEQASSNVIHAVVNNEVVALDWLSDSSNDKVSKTKAGVSVRYKLHNLKAINGTISSGYLNIGPKQKTPIQIVKKHNIMFKVEEGRGIIIIYGKKNFIEVGTVFYIPLGIQYSVVNLEKEQLTLFFTKIKVVP